MKGLFKSGRLPSKAEILGPQQGHHAPLMRQGLFPGCTAHLKPRATRRWCSRGSSSGMGFLCPRELCQETRRQIHTARECPGLSATRPHPTQHFSTEPSTTHLGVSSPPHLLVHLLTPSSCTAPVILLSACSLPGQGSVRGWPSSSLHHPSSQRAWL